MKTRRTRQLIGVAALGVCIFEIADFTLHVIQHINKDRDEERRKQYECLRRNDVNKKIRKDPKKYPPRMREDVLG